MNFTSEQSDASAGAGVPNIPALLVATRRALRERRTEAALESAAVILTEPSALLQLERVFAGEDRLRLLIRLLWDQRETAFRNLAAVAAYMRMSAAVGIGDRRARRLRSWLLAESTAPVRFSLSDYIGGLTKRDKGRLLDLFLIKYQGWVPDKFTDSIEELAGRCDIPPRISEFLYQKTTYRHLDFPSWLHDVMLAQAFGHFFKDAISAASLLRREREGAGRYYLEEIRDRYFLEEVFKGAAPANCVDMQQVKSFFERLDTSRGLVLCTFHGAFPTLLQSLFHKIMPDHYCIGLGPRTAEGKTEVKHGRRGTAFRAVKSLMQKKAVLMAPDGPHLADAAAAEIRVFGAPARVSMSAAFFAFEAKSDTGWCSFVRENDRFVPVYVPGPRPDRGEPFEQFKDRWLSFYAAQIENVLSSDPKNLTVPLARWSFLGINGQGEADTNAPGTANLHAH